MNAVFIELPAFDRYRANYLDDDGFRCLQDTLMANAKATSHIERAREERAEDEEGA